MKLVLDLFSGIGGFSLGLERAGMRTVAFCEIDKKCQLVLKKHWPNVTIFDDVKNLRGTMIDEKIEVICGGFPCQDISFAGSGAGLSGKRSGLWFEFHRLINEIRPKFAIIENVAALRSRGLDQVLWSLFEIGYDAQWHCIPASAVGAPHRRDRVWIIAYPNDARSGAPSNGGNKERSAIVKERENKSFDRFSGLCALMAGTAIAEFWAVEPELGRVANGVPDRVDRIKQLGNSVIPQIAELIGRSIFK